MKKYGYILFSFMVTLLILVANVASASACLWAHYQPDVPESLKK